MSAKRNARLGKTKPTSDGNQLLQGVERIRANLERWKQADGKPWGIESGFPSLDHITGGLHKGQMTIIGARSSHGKTSLATQIALYVASELKNVAELTTQPQPRVLFFSPEMTPDQLDMRLACQMAQVNSVKIQSGEATEADYADFEAALREIETLSDVLDLRSSGASDIHAIIDIVTEAAASEPGVALVVIDYIQRLSGAPGKSDYERTSWISRELKNLTIDLDIPMIVLSQLSRQAGRREADKEQDPVPTLDDLRDSGKVGEDADNVGLLYNPRDLTNEMTGNKRRTAVLSLDKNRNGPVGRIQLYFVPQWTLFIDPCSIRAVKLDGGH